MCSSARTTTRVGRHANKKHKEQHPKMRRQTNLCLLVQCFALSVCVSVTICVYMCKRTNANPAIVMVTVEMTIVKVNDGEGKVKSVSPLPV